MPRRDPNTGQFVSGESVNWDDLDVVTGSLTSTIPAADLAGTKATFPARGESTEIVDMSSTLTRGEVFEIHRFELVATLTGPTTATAEGDVQLEWALTRDLDVGEVGVSNPFYAGAGSQSEVRSDGVIDLHNFQTDEDAVLSVGRLTCSPSHRDTTTGTGGGAAEGFDRVIRHFGAGPRLDEDDELGAPHTFSVNGIDDHSVAASFDLLVEGRIQDV